VDLSVNKSEGLEVWMFYHMTGLEARIDKAPPSDQVVQ